MGAVDIKMTQEQELTLEWDSSASNDMIADSTLALLTSIDKSPASVKRAPPTSILPPTPLLTHLFLVTSHSHAHTHAHPHAEPDGAHASELRIQRLAMFLEAHFAEVELHVPDADTTPMPGDDERGQIAGPSLVVILDDAEARIEAPPMPSPPVRAPNRTTLLPTPEAFASRMSSWRSTPTARALTSGLPW